MKSYTSILAQILRLRQSCCHPTLIRRKEIVEDELEAEAAYDAAKGFSDDMDLHALIDRFSDEGNETNANTYGAEILKQIRDEVEHECPICLAAPMRDMTVTGCYHAACKECWAEVIEVLTSILDLSGLATNFLTERERERGIAEMRDLSRTDKRAGSLRGYTTRIG